MNPKVNFNKEYIPVTKEGSLSLLALGYTGIMLWRSKRAENETQQYSKQ